MARLSIEKFYSEKNKETTKAVDSYLLNNVKDKKILWHIKRRQKTSPTKIKSFFIRIGFEIGNSNSNWKIIIPLCATCELLNLGNYLIERGNDENSNNEIDLGRKIRKLVLLDNALLSEERKIFKKIIYGIDKYLKIDNKSLIWNKVNRKNYLKAYKQKCSLVGGQYYAHCLELGFLKSGNKNKIVKKHLMKIGETFGTAYQMLHEVADLLPENLKRFPEDFKYYQKQYNSLRKRKITLPIYFALYEWNSFDKKLFFRLVNKKNFGTITKIFLKEKIIKRCKTFIRKFVKSNKKEFQFLPQGKWTDCLKLAVNAVNSNIFWKLFKRLYARVA